LDGKPFEPKEIEIFKKLTGKQQKEKTWP